MYIDANVFIIAATVNGEDGDAARELLSEVHRGRMAMTSVLAMDEVMWVLRKNGYASRTRGIIENIYKIRNLEVRDVPAFTALRALDFMEKHKLKPRDAFHAALMESLKVKEIASSDADFDRVPGIKRIKV